MSSRLLILTAGTNPHAIASVLARVKEFFDYNNVLILATSASKNDAEVAKNLIKSIIPNMEEIKIEINADLMDSLFKESISANVFDTTDNIRSKIKERCDKFNEIYIDITGGTKLMSSVVATVASSLKAKSGETKVGSPCEGTTICIGYLTHIELASNAYSWWSHRLDRNVGYYPKIPRILEVPWSVNAETWGSCHNSETTLLKQPSEVTLPYFRYFKTLEPFLESVGDITWLLNSLTFDRLEISIERKEKVETLVKVKGWGKLDIKVDEGGLPKALGVTKEGAEGFLTFNGFNTLRVEKIGGNKHLRELLNGEALSKRPLWEFLLYLRIKGFKGPIFLDSSVIMKGFHNEFFYHDIVASLLGQKVYVNKLNIVVPHCIFYEILRKYEEDRKSERRESHQDFSKVLEFAITSVSAMVANLFKKEVGPLLSFCDPALHELIAKEEGILITADSGLYENVNSDDSVRGVVVNVRDARPEAMQLQYVLNKTNLHYSSNYIMLIEKLSDAMREHAKVTQLLALLAMTLRGDRMIRIEGEEKVRLRKAEGKAKVERF